MLRRSITFAVRNDYTYVLTESPELHILLKDKMKVIVPGAEHSNQVKFGTWDGTKSYYNLRTQRFKTGLLSWAIKILRETPEGNPPTIKALDQREKPSPVTYAKQFEAEDFKTALREYQQEAVDVALHCTRGILNLATGAGKSEIAFAIIHRLHVLTLFLVNGRLLLHQTAKRMMDTIPGAVIQVIGDSAIEQFGEGSPWIFVAMIQTLAKKPHIIKGRKFGLKIADECHGVPAKTWTAAMEVTPTYYSYGLSGSFDEKYETEPRYYGTIAELGKPIVVLPAEYLVARGFLAQPDISMVQYSPRIELQHKRAKGAEGFLAYYDAAVTRCNLLNETVVPLLMKALVARGCKRMLILVTRVEHAITVHNRLKERGLAGAVLTGSDASAHRVSVLENLAKGQLQYVVATRILNQGVDVPAIDGIINLGCDGSYKNVFQKLGRGLRISEGKSSLLYFDIWPVGVKYLDNEAGWRKQKYEHLGFPAKVVQVIRKAHKFTLRLDSESK